MGFFSELTGNSEEHSEQIEPFAPAVGKAGFECGLGLLFPKRSFRPVLLEPPENAAGRLERHVLGQFGKILAYKAVKSFSQRLDV
jgi:hypothetical protein